MEKSVPPSLTALGRRSLPARIDVAGRRYERRRVFKNDFFAVTAMYESEGDRVILKVHRQAPFLLLPMRWVGRILAAREAAAFRFLGDLDGVPRIIDRWSTTGIIREYVAGHTLAKGERVDDAFHGRLRDIVDVIHARGMAYVDLEKCENVLVGEDGRPHLFDFQICWYLPRRFGGELWPVIALRRWFQRGDLYHLAKLQRRTRPDQMSPEALAASYRKPWYLRVHRFLTYPFTWCRRRVLDRLDPRRRVGERGRIAEEEAVRPA